MSIPANGSPAWFDRALATTSEQGSIEVEGAAINYRVWGPAGAPGVVLVHGSNAHLEWWRFVAPFLADQFRVAALDLSGNGDSGWRETYSGELFAKETFAVAQAAGLGDKPFVVGHSFGGYVALETGHLFGDRLGGIIMNDFTVSAPETYTEWGRRAEREGKTKRGTRVYEDQDAALARFRFIPEQPNRFPAVTDYIARASLRPVDGGWTWKFDPTLFDDLEMGVAQRDKFAGLPCPSAVVLGEHSTDSGAQDAPYMMEISAGLLPVIEIPNTYHHMMFEEPLALTMAIKGLLLAWRAEGQSDTMKKALESIRE